MTDSASSRTVHAVTGAFGFSGKYVARRLLDEDRRVMTLTNSPNRPDPFQGRVAGPLSVPGARASGGIRLSDWMEENKGTIGRVYHAELGRRDNRRLGY
jgi:nucleoside-diphosphate-sugar epimerase